MHTYYIMTEQYENSCCKISVSHKNYAHYVVHQNTIINLNKDISTKAFIQSFIEILWSFYKILNT